MVTLLSLRTLLTGLPVRSPGCTEPPRRPARRAAIAVAAALTLTAGSVVAAAPAGANPLDDAKARLVGAQQAADAVAQRYEAAIGRAEELDAGIATLRAQISDGRKKAAALRGLARHQAAVAYESHNVSDGSGFPLGGDPLDSVRRAKLLAPTRRRENAAVARLASVNADLRTRQHELEHERAAQAAALAQATAEQQQVQTQLAAAQHALSALVAELSKQVAAQRARDIAASIARTASNHTNGRSYSGVYIATGIVCPVRGAVSFIDSFGAPRHQGPHMGVDLMAARGTPDVAVIAGSVSFRSGSTSGNGAFLNGDDGNLYYYFHLDSYAGAARRVHQGEVIGYVGNTGDARYTATHTHFEIHPGHGPAVNPYPSVRAVC